MVIDRGSFRALRKVASKLVFACVCFGFLLCSSAAWSHPFAVSSFSAHTAGETLRLDFQFDATSVLEFIERKRPALAPAEKLEIDRQKEMFLTYFHDRFSIANAGRTCIPLPESIHYGYQESLDRLQFRVNYTCESALERLQIESTLFLDEENPHHLIGTLHHKRARERYFFTGGERKAEIELERLRQRNSNFAPNGTFRIATPPRRPSAKGDRTYGRNGAANKEHSEPARPDEATGGASRESSDSGSPQNISSFSASFLTFLHQGLLHIFGGLDHLLFVFSLILGLRSWKRLLLVLSSFTLAHSFTLVAGALGWVRVSPQLAEPLIALTIAYVAARGLTHRLRSQPAGKESELALGVTFAFGLIHGFGFGSALQDLGFSGLELVPALIGFNLGVELGQIALVAPIFPLLLWLRRRQPARRSMLWKAGYLVILLVAIAWFVERVV